MAVVIVIADVLFGGPAARRPRSMGSHQDANTGSDVWLTPPALLQALGPFDLDPCAAPDPRPWPTARIHYTVAVDGLRQPWSGRVFCNPPYSAVGRWLTRLADHGIGTALIFARTETRTFHDQVWDRATATLFLRGRVTFCRADGIPGQHNGGAPSVLVAYGTGDADRLARCGLPGRYIDLGGAS